MGGGGGDGGGGVKRRGWRNEGQDVSESQRLGGAAYRANTS